MAKYYDEVENNGKRALKIINEDGKQLITLLSTMLCTDSEIANELGMDEDTMKNNNNKAIFSECKHKGQERGKVSLRRMQFKSAEKGNVTMQIFLGKQILGQKEVQEVKSEVNMSNPYNNLTEEELKKLAGE